MWAVAQTKPRQENKAQINLNNQGYTCYLPIIKRKKFIHNTWVTCNEVFFSNYIFIDLNSCKTSLSKINNTIGISKLLVNKDLSIPYTIDEKFIIDLKKYLKKGIDINNLKKGSKVSITKGKLSNFTAIFLEKCSKTRSKVLISLLNRDYIATIDSNSLQRAYQ
tara:strand:- start:141 stop:632 length:492 start_codon:yes stop_codon:yes gene_type:complete